MSQGPSDIEGTARGGIPDPQLAAVGLQRFFGPKLGDLTRAINAASEASERHAKSLTRATWVLAGATVVLAAATLALVYVTAKS